jgi:hypothetical protein
VKQLRNKQKEESKEEEVAKRTGSSDWNAGTTVKEHEREVLQRTFMRKAKEKNLLNLTRIIIPSTIVK